MKKRRKKRNQLLSHRLQLLHHHQHRPHHQVLLLHQRHLYHQLRQHLQRLLHLLRYQHPLRLSTQSLLLCLYQLPSLNHHLWCLKSQERLKERENLRIVVK